jgi:hypothetical protein
MAQTSGTSSLEQSYNRFILPSPWQKDKLSHLPNHTNDNKKRKLDSPNKNMNISTYNSFELLESTHDSIDIIKTSPSQQKQKTPPPLPIETIRLKFCRLIQTFIEN